MHLVLFGLLGCPAVDSSVPVDTGFVDTGFVDTGTAPCEPTGTFSCPIAVDEFPFVDERNTQNGPQSVADTYACAPQTDESGPEWVYAVDVVAPGVLSAALTTGNDAGVDIDIHLLSAADVASCVARDHIETVWLVEPGRWYIVADTFVNSADEPQSGAYTLVVDFQELPGGECAMENRELRMFWSECAPGIDCRVDGDVLLNSPSLGPVVKEAHLVTTQEWEGTWPTSFTDGIAAHYVFSESHTNYEMARREPWAPAGEGGSEFGQGATGSPVPAEHEAWYLNMHWRDRPAKGTRMLVINPANGLAVVAAGGYETGPGTNTAIGGVAEEVHDALQSGHRDDLIIGYLADQTLVFGPIDCR